MTGRIVTSNRPQVLRFVGGLVADVSTCPDRIQAHTHWRELAFPGPECGDGNAVCAHRWDELGLDADRTREDIEDEQTERHLAEIG